MEGLATGRVKALCMSLSRPQSAGYRTEKWGIREANIPEAGVD